MKVSVLKKSSIAIMLASVLMVVALVVPISANAASKSEAAKAAKPGSQTIADIAISSGSFNTLVTALSCTDLVPAVSGTKQLTVFAPTDAAFAKLGLDSSNVCDLEGLSNILLYHVMSGRHTSTSVLARDSYRMLNGETLTKAEIVTAGTFSLNNSASNGVIHIINSVLIP